MARWVALLRGVNVGGGNKVPMADLRALCESYGWRNVATYIASGNLVFDADAGDHGTRLRAGLIEMMGVDVPVMILPAETIVSALESLPFDVEKGNQAHAFFLFGEARVDTALRDALLADNEALVVMDRVAWLHAPDGIGRSKLVEKITKVLGTEFTARNLNTVRKLVDMVA